ncbi:hypothetical protein [Herbiconiux sp. L3-i23]|uniref:hypothetical protein n=1 Tax=Herbiconiux sp. L3-i23 TaxID=2905871 RepID=UPI0020683F06|nr:hypothetical protein [Herbiconiux sp. L3-i23]BDI22557.1 hypothetical protein L3i23_13330 [Herbiconiux sp. L3-i23]
MSEVDSDGLSEREFGSLKKLARKNFAKFAVAIQHVSTEAQLKLIEQLPEFRKLAMGAVESISSAFEATLDADERSEAHVHEGYREWRRALISLLEQQDLSLDEKLRIASLIGETVKEQAQFDSRGKAFKKEVLAKVGLSVLGVVGVIALALTGGKLMVDDETDDA